MPVPKTAIQELSGEQLEMLVSFGKSDEFQLVSKVVEAEKFKRYQTDFLIAKNTEDIALIRGINVGMDYVIDMVSRAREELLARGAKEDQIDND